MTELDKVKRLVETRQEELYNLIIKKNNMLDIQVLAVGEKLNNIIGEYYRLLRKNY